MFTMRIMLILGLILALESGAFYVYYKYQVAKDDALTLRVTAAETATAQLKDQQQHQEQELADSQRKFDQLSANNETIRQAVSALKSKFRNTDLDKLGRTNPAGATAQVNSVISASFGQLSTITKPVVKPTPKVTK